MLKERNSTDRSCMLGFISLKQNMLKKSKNSDKKVNGIKHGCKKRLKL